MNRLNVLTKSISESPTLISILPPVLYNSLFKTVFKIGSILSTSYINNGHPNLKHVSKFFVNESSEKLVVVILFFL